jgi:hypothetical protein
MAGEALWVLDQCLQQMFGEQVLVAARQGLHLRRLQNAARAFGQIREVHSGTPVFPALQEARDMPPAARPMRDRSALLPKWSLERLQSSACGVLHQVGPRPSRPPFTAAAGETPAVR